MEAYQKWPIEILEPLNEGRTEHTYGIGNLFSHLYHHHDYHHLGEMNHEHFNTRHVHYQNWEEYRRETN